MKRQSIEWEKIFTNEATDEGLISNIFLKTLAAEHQKKKNNQKWTEGLNRYLSKEDIQMAKNHMKGCSAS